jgi:hypothetical protein
MNFVAMKQISEVEEKLLMSSLNICPEACGIMGGGGQKKNNEVTIILSLGFLHGFGQKVAETHVY